MYVHVHLYTVHVYYEFSSNHGVQLYDHVFTHFQGNYSINAFYSTPSMYVDALHKAGEVWPVKEDDFFPYADKKCSYMTGYYTSRPALKRYVRLCNSHLQACKQLEAMNNVSTNDRSNSSRTLRECSCVAMVTEVLICCFLFLEHAMGVAQHHDAVT